MINPRPSIAARATVDFFDRYLKHDSGALQKLATDTNVPGTARLQEATGYATKVC